MSNWKKLAIIKAADAEKLKEDNTALLVSIHIFFKEALVMITL
jgi:hypothetical protein